MAEKATPADKETKLQRIVRDVRQRRSLPADGYSGDPKVLEIARAYEKQGGSVAIRAGLISAKAEDIERLALIDGLTELYNYRAFLKELKAELNRAKRYKHPVSLCMLAIDDFASIAEKYGPLTADAVLKVTAHVLRGAVRDNDILAKYNDQNFCVVLPQTAASSAALVAERIRSRIGNQAIVHNWQTFSVSSSIGVAAFPAHASEYDELIARSIEALNHATTRGGDRVFSV